jgi:glutamate synthase (NADPH/NADH) small chain
MELGEPDESGRRRPNPTGEKFAVDAETVVLAIGYSVAEDLPEAAGVELADGVVIIDAATGVTNRAGVFAGGDCVNGADLVVTAIGDGRRAAAAIHEYLGQTDTAAA